MRTWTERYPGRLEHELAEFERRGLKFELDEELLAEQGRVILRGVIERDREKIALQVEYPDFFPFIRPEVSAPGLKVSRHQSPFGGNLCLLDRSTRAWKPSYTAAWLVSEKVPYLLDLLDSGEEVMRAAEAPQGEPMTTYFQGTPGTVIFVPDSILKLNPEATGGSGRIACAPFEGPGLWLRGAIAELIEKGPKGKTQTLGRIEEPLRARFGGAEVAFRWARLLTLPTAGTPIAVLEAVESARPGFGTPPWESIPGGEIAVSGAVVSEEVTQGVYEDAWLFVVQYRNEQQEGRYLIRGDRLGRDELEARLPSEIRLADSIVSLSGLGALGGDLVIELAKAGVGTIRGLDFDTVEAGTTMRWTTGITAAGRLKTGYMNQRIPSDYPFTRFEPYLMRIGGSAAAVGLREETEIDAIELFLRDCDLLIDATAEIGVQQALAASADEQGVRQLFVSATEGALGGLVASINPAEGGCWMCLQLAIESSAIPLPAHAEPATLQPRGCSSLTYTGAGFDLLPVVAQGARVAAAVLNEEGTTVSRAYVCSLPTKRPAPPQWSEHVIEPHPECPNCGNKQ
jgi:molybdopterin/thiamine biosynthesis adenylyltransferase